MEENDIDQAAVSHDSKYVAPQENPIPDGDVFLSSEPRPSFYWFCTELYIYVAPVGFIQYIRFIKEFIPSYRKFRKAWVDVEVC